MIHKALGRGGGRLVELSLFHNISRRGRKVMSVSSFAWSPCNESNRLVIIIMKTWKSFVTLIKITLTKKDRPNKNMFTFVENLKMCNVLSCMWNSLPKLKKKQNPKKGGLHGLSDSVRRLDSLYKNMRHLFRD